MSGSVRRWLLCLLGGLLVSVAGVSSTEVVAQQSSSRTGPLAFAEVRNSPVVERGDYLVVIDLDANELHFMQGRTVLWSAPVGTGMGLRLQTDDRNWTFSTPTGEYQVQYKEENPVWVAPDWFFIENKLPVPPQNDPRRRFPGGLGAAAVHIGRGLAIHGTDKPDLLGQRVSHGCIRLANHYAQRLYHNVQVGTKVLIVGEDEGERGELIPGQVPGTGPVDARTQRLRDRTKAARENLLKELGALETERLVERLGEELAVGEETEGEPRWPETASALIGRAVKDGDVDAARGLLETAGTVRGRRVRAEYLTYLADLYRRGSPATTAALAQMDERGQRAAARAIVEATVALFAGGAEAANAPWPTRRIPRTVLAEDAQPGWDAIQAAERSYRERRPATTAPRVGRL
jgi:lipoprotein-anchoring transpeptidase ErfK/SrfK